MRLLFFAGSARDDALNKKLARLGRHIAEANGIEAVFADLADYHMPIYHGDLEAAKGPPERALAFAALLAEYDGVFIATPEYNASIPALAITGAGQHVNSSGSRITQRARNDACRMERFVFVAEFVNTETVVASEPVPAVVGTAIKGIRLASMGSPS